MSEKWEWNCGGHFAPALRWTGRYSRLRGCADRSALRTAKIPRRRPIPIFPTDSLIVKAGQNTSARSWMTHGHNPSVRNFCSPARFLFWHCATSSRRHKMLVHGSFTFCFCLLPWVIVNKKPCLHGVSRVGEILNVLYLLTPRLFILPPERWPERIMDRSYPPRYRA